MEDGRERVSRFGERSWGAGNGAGRVEGPTDEVARDPQVKAVYLGEGADA